MKPYPIKTPKIIQNIFRSLIWNITTDKKEIYLTFDDGPIPEITPWVVETLSKFNAKATFFCIGENVKNYSTIFQEIINNGHSIGNHTYNHLKGWKTNTKEYLNNIEKAERSLQYPVTSSLSSIKPATKLFRPPYGKIKPNQVKQITKKGYEIIMWDVLSGDFDQNLSKENCLKNVVGNTKKGSIVVFHDSQKAFKNLQYTLPKVLEHFTEKGFVFKAL